MADHTPAPWELECEPWHDDADLCVWSADGKDSDDGVSIALVVPTDVGVETRNANARLIAAAPVLADLLREHVTEASCYCDDHFLVRPGEKCWVCRARAALAKALPPEGGPA